jgi:hypothetical protein
LAGLVGVEAAELRAALSKTEFRSTFIDFCLPCPASAFFATVAPVQLRRAGAGDDRRRLFLRDASRQTHANSNRRFCSRDAEPP